jgi:2-dehydro-3-deoxygluconokinase
MQFDQFDWSRLTGARFLHLTGITAAISPAGAELVRRAVGWAREHQIPVSLDVNYRSLLWSPDRCRQTLEPLLPGVELLLVSARDAGTVFGLSGEPERVARTLGQRCRQVALTTGEAGAIGYKEGKCFVVPGYKVDILNRIGAGDSFAAGVLWGLLEGDFGRGLEFGVAMSALTLTIAGDSFSFTRQDVENLVAHGPGLNVVR